MVLDVLAGALMMVVLASLVARFSRKARHSTVLLAVIGPYALVLVAASVILLLASGAPLPALAALVVGATVLAAQVQPWLRRPRRDGVVPVLTVLTANLREGQGDPSALARLAREHAVDVIALQEVTPEALAALRGDGIDADYPHTLDATADRWNGVALLSRHPLRDPLVTRRGDLLRAEAVVGIDPLEPDRDPAVLSVHVHAPWPPAPRPWREQLDELAEDLPERARPVIVAGDFNATLDHQPFRRLLRLGVRDAAVDAGAWWMRTYHAGLPAIAIDHVVVAGLVGLSASAHRVPGSDHLAVVVVLGRTPGGQPV